jgi:lipoyl(octanoyl) transferase
MRWHIFVTAPLGGSRNMAIDEALLRRARESGDAVLRIYTWKRPTLSLGRNQVARGRYDLTRARDMGVDIVRRPTGGRAVLHHRELTYSVTAPDAKMGSLHDAYGRINRLLLRALESMGVPVSIASPRSRAPLPGVAPCFELPTRGELVVRGQKLVGSAQWREDGALLQHGSVLIDDDQPLIAELLNDPLPVPTPPAATLRSVLGRAPDAAELADALLDAIVTLEDAEASHIAMDHALDAAALLASVRYEDDGWTWRR